MKHTLLSGAVWHSRKLPKLHSFKYPLICLGLDLDSISNINNSWPLLGYNKWRICSFFDSDYLAETKASLKQKLIDALPTEIKPQINQATLISMPRLLGYVFNPISFYLCFNQAQQICCFVLEVSNTFGERHIYPLMVPEEKLGRFPVHFEFPKEFFVSPFFDRSGEYVVTINSSEEFFKATVELYKDKISHFIVKMELAQQKLTQSGLLKALLIHPFSILLAMTKIQIEALRLFLFKSVQVYSLPVPLNSFTLRSHQNWIHALRLRALRLMRWLRG